MPTEFCADRTSTIANLRNAIAKIRIFEHFFDISQLVRPLGKFVSCEWSPGSIVGSESSTFTATFTQRRPAFPGLPILLRLPRWLLLLTRLLPLLFAALPTSLSSVRCC
jgi:hypothetical protein